MRETNDGIRQARRGLGVRRRRVTRAAIGLCLAAALVAACGGGDDSADAGASTTSVAGAGAGSSTWEEIVEAAKKEGRVVFYATHPDPTIERVVEGFSKAYPEIKLEMPRVVSSEMAGRLEAESKGGRGGADMIATTSVVAVKDLDERGLLAPIKGPQLQELAELWGAQPELRPTDNSVITYGTGYWFAWNTDQVKEPVNSWDELVERADEFRGQVGFPDWVGSNAPVWYIQVEEQKSGVDVTKDLTADGKIPQGFLSKLGPLEPVFGASAQPLTQSLGAGEVKLVVYTVASMIDELKSRGAPIDAALPTDTATGATAVTAITTWGENPNAAQVLMNWLLTEEGQEASAGLNDLGLYDDLPGAAGGPDQIRPSRAALEDKALIDRMRVYWGAAFNR